MGGISSYGDNRSVDDADIDSEWISNLDPSNFEEALSTPDDTVCFNTVTYSHVEQLLRGKTEKDKKGDGDELVFANA